MEKIFTNNATDKGLVSKIYKWLMWLYIKKKKKNRQKTRGVISPKKIYRWARVTWKDAESGTESRSVVSNSLQPHGLHSPWILQARILKWVSFPSPADLPNPRIEPRSPTLQADSLPAETQGKPKNTGLGSLSLLQQIFLTQESNWGLLHCWQILYQLSYQGSSEKMLDSTNLNDNEIITWQQSERSLSKNL